MGLERPSTPYAADEVATLRGFLDWYRVTLRRQCDGLDQQQLATPLAPSTMTLGGMLKHLTYVEQWWFATVFAGGAPEGIWAEVDWDADQDWDWHSAAEDTPAQLMAWHEEEVARSDAVLEAALANGGLDLLAQQPRRNGEHASLRWILVHMIEEYARHAGHADLLRESIDGAVDL